ncbi:hypothetical protein VPHK394_0063 [Vibrio phage K394]
MSVGNSPPALCNSPLNKDGLFPLLLYITGG